MGITVSDSGGSFTPCPEGTYNAVCIGMVDLGLQETQFGEKGQVALCFEVDEQMSDGRNFVQWAFYTKSLNQKATLYQHLISWRGKKFTEDELKAFDLEKVLGAPCMVSIVHNENGKAKVGGIAKLPKGMAPLQPSEGTFLVDSSTKVQPIGCSDYFWTTAQEGFARERAKNDEGAGASASSGQVDTPVDLDDEVPF